MCAFLSRWMIWTAPLLLALSATTASAQSAAILQGRVLAADGSILPGASVTLAAVDSSDPRATAADTDGRFAFAEVRPGAYRLDVTLDGFEPTVKAVMIEPRETRVVTVTLEIARVHLNVDVSAAATIPRTHSPSSTLLTGERIEDAGVFARSGLPEAIVTSAPGMVRSHDDFVHIRGHEVALNPLLDGIGFWENTHAVFSAGIAPDVIDTATVMTGGFPAEYGNRFGGVVDAVTKSGLRMHERGSATVAVGGAGRRQGAAELSARRGAFGAYLFGSALESKRFLSPPDPTAIHDDGQARHAFARIDRAGSRVGSIAVVAMGDGIDLQIPKTPRDAELRPAANAEQRNRQQTLTASWSRSASRSAIDASVYQRRSSVHLLPASGPLTAQASLHRELTTIGGKANVARLAGRHTVKLGLDAVTLRPREELLYDYAGYRDLTHLTGLPHVHIADQRIAFSGRDAGSEASGYVQDNIQLGSRVTADVGVRLDRYSLVVRDTGVSPRVNLAIRIGDASVLHASYNRFFVPPPVEGVLSSSAGLTSAIREVGRALPPIRPAIEDQFEVGGSTRWGAIQVASTAYYRATDNPVHTTVWPDARIYSYASFDRARAYGMEAKLDVPGAARYGITAYANCALGRVHFWNPVTGGFITDGEHLAATDRFPAPMDQTHTLTAGGTYRHAPSGVTGGMTIEYGSGTPIGHGGTHQHADGEVDHQATSAGPTAARIPGHVTANASLALDLVRDARQRSRLTLRVDVENLTGHADVVARDGEFSQAQFAAPRLWSLTARVRF